MPAVPEFFTPSDKAAVSHASSLSRACSQREACHIHTAGKVSCHSRDTGCRILQRVGQPCVLRACVLAHFTLGIDLAICSPCRLLHATGSPRRRRARALLWLRWCSRKE